MSRLRITEIFHSLQGESRSMGWPTAFIRLTGCPLRCGYCDTAYAFAGGEWMTIDHILNQVTGFGAHHVTVTGGEPLAQPDSLLLLTRLCDAGYEVSLETSGALDISAVDPRVIKVMDLKTPDSGEMKKNLYSNLAHLQAQDQVKFVLCSREDYDWAKDMLLEYGIATRCEVLFSPSHGQLAPRTLAEWILSDHLPVRFQIQLHKILWGAERGR
ncbi:MAG: 7-carboxy-7-deazaguanine synthase QueE [Gammaproteobacteria bacterium RBG_16_57_12]|nr:MAG: 7-carboxy-7-deazaguanine synthase QueE [Gammaproteobacteria bacterium RBG_16_57_12]